LINHDATSVLQAANGVVKEENTDGREREHHWKNDKIHRTCQKDCKEKYQDEDTPKQTEEE
jgi:hypothetical protein